MTELIPITPSQTWQLRHEVLWPDKPFDYVKLEEDHDGLHFGFVLEEQLISVISLFITDQTAQFRKFATESSQQGKGYGTTLLKHVIAESTKRNVQTLWCNARQSASGFYERLGFNIVSEVWMKEGIPYVTMAKELK